MPFPLRRREGVFRQVLSKSGEKIVISHEFIDDQVDYGRKIRRKVRLVGTTFLALEPLLETSSRFTIVQYLDAGGNIPAWVVNQKLPEILSVAEDLRKEFSRDEEVDKEIRNQLALRMQSGPERAEEVR